MTEILLVRHGQTQANATGLWQGWSDAPLNMVGQAQAEAIARRLASEPGQIGAIYTSSLRRARQTAQIIGRQLALELRVLEQLKEIHFGRLDGTTLADMQAKFPALYARWEDKTDMTFQWPGGERRADFFKRAAEACKLIQIRHGRDKVVVVAHGGTIRACLAYFLPDLLGAWWSYDLDNAGLTRIRPTEHGTQLLSLNDTHHLRQNGS